MAYYSPSYYGGASYQSVYNTQTYGNSAFAQVITFFEKLGVYDIVLPFLLVFTIVYAIFERTKVLGTENIEGVEYSKKNLNAMVAFVIAFLVIASSRIVSIINESLAKIVVLIFMGVFFLLLIGIFYSEKEEVILEGGWRVFFMVAMFIGIVLIFLHSIPTRSGEPWLYWITNFVIHNFRTTAVSSIVLLVVIIGFMFLIIREPNVDSVPKTKE